MITLFQVKRAAAQTAKAAQAATAGAGRLARRATNMAVTAAAARAQRTRAQWARTQRTRAQRARAAAWVCAVAIAACTALAGCSASGEAARAKTPYDPAEIAEVILSTQPESPVLSALTPDYEDFAIRVDTSYEIDPDSLIDGVICAPDGFEANEIAILRFGDAETAEDAVAALEAYKESRVNAYAGYAPDQSALAQRGEIRALGHYAALMICEEEADAVEAFASCFEDTPPALPETRQLLSWSDNPDEAESGDEQTSAPTAPTPTTTATTGVMPDAGVAADAGKPPATTATTGVMPDAGDATDTGGAADTSEPPTATAATTQATATTTAPTETTTTTTTETTTTTPTETTTTLVTPDASVTPDSGAPSAPAPADDVFDSAQVLSAWNTGDFSALSGKNLTVAQKCAEVIDELIADDMSIYEKELAIHDWIIDHAEYDWAVDSQNPNAEPSPDNDNVYGLLVYNKAICSGYSSTFQLFMDIIGVECMTVKGEANAAREEHAWNLVRLEDGEWYCVDVTWDDPFGNILFSDSISHNYFNVTSDYLRARAHFWDEANVPECDSTLYAWGYV